MSKHCWLKVAKIFDPAKMNNILLYLYADFFKMVPIKTANPKPIKCHSKIYSCDRSHVLKNQHLLFFMHNQYIFYIFFYVARVLQTVKKIVLEKQPAKGQWQRGRGGKYRCVQIKMPYSKKKKYIGDRSMSHSYELSRDLSVYLCIRWLIMGSTSIQKVRYIWATVWCPVIFDQKK